MSLTRRRLKAFLHLLILNLFIIQFANGQNCVSDSVVVRGYYEYRSLTDLVQRIIETSVFNRDSGMVRISTQSAVSGGGYTPSSIIDTFWVHTDTIRNASGTIAQIYSKIGSSSGWKNYKTENFQYNISDFILSRTKLSWNGSAWDSVSFNTWIYDVQNQLIESADYAFSSAVRNNVERREMVYLNGQAYSKTFSSGIAVNQWEFVRRFTFTYTGNLRTNVDVDNYDSGSASWQVYGHFAYDTNFGEYSFILPEYTPIVLNGISSADTLLTGYDTLEEMTYTRSVHFTAIDTTDIYFGVQGVIYYDIYNHFNNVLQISYSWSSSWASLDLTDSTWYSVDRPYQVHYFYDLNGRCDTIISLGACTNPCGGEQYFLYDSLGRMHYTSAYSWTMVSDHFISNTYYYSDTSSVSILIASNDSNVTGCPGGTFQPNVAVIGGCQPYTVHWHPPAGLSSDTVLQPDILIDSTITYTLTVLDNMGRIDSSTVTVNPGYSPELIVDSVYCNGNTDLHLPWADGVFNWYLDSVIIPGAGTNSFTAISPGAYHVSGSVDIGSIYSHLFTCPIQSDTVTVFPVVQPVLSFSNDTLLTSFFGIQYEWFRNNVSINTSADSFLIVNQPGIYQVAVTLLSGCTYTSDSLNVLNAGITEPQKIFSVFPNPVHDKLLIHGYKGEQAFITDLAGKQIFQTHINTDYSLDVSFLTDGSYFLIINTETTGSRYFFIKM